MYARALYSIVTFAFIGSMIAMLVVFVPTRFATTVSRIEPQIAAIAGSGSGLIAHYTFDEGSGTTANDSAGSTAGTLANGPTWTAGKNGGALSFDGLNDAVSIFENPLNSRALTISMWLKPRGYGQITAYILDDGKTSIRYVNGYRPCFSSDGTTCVNAPVNSLPFSVWSHLTVTRNASGVTNFFINGEVVGTTNQNSGTPTEITGAFKIGNSQNGFHTYDGLIDDVRIYNRVLTVDEISEIYNYSGPSSESPESDQEQSEPVSEEETEALVSQTPVQGVYTVKKNGTGNFTSINSCAEVVKQGEKCLVFPGIYEERVVIASSGSNSLPITFEASGVGVIVRGFNITGSYIMIKGFEVTHLPTVSAYLYPAVLVVGGTGIEVENNNIHHVSRNAINFGNVQFLTIRGNQISYVGYLLYPTEGYTAFSGIFGQPSNDVLIENNTVSYVADYLTPYGTRYVFRNNILGPTDPRLKQHIDGVQPNGITTNSLVEGNLSKDNASSDNHFFLNQLEESDGWIIRRNITTGSNGGLDWRNADRHFFYNNTFYNNFAYYNSGFQVLLTSSSNNIARNNIWYRSVRTNGNPYAVGSGSGIDKDYDLWFDSGNPVENHAVNADPLFVNVGVNFELSSNSPAIDKGGALTFTTNSGTRSTSLQVSEPGMFQPGWANVSADWVSVGSPGNYAQIKEINYVEKIIKLDSPLTWSEGAPVYLYKDSTGRKVLYGTAPDIGAFEFDNGEVNYTPPVQTNTNTPTNTQTPVTNTPTQTPVNTPVTQTPTITGINLSSVPDFNMDLSRGSTAKEVLVLQTLLVAEGYLSGSYTDGIYDKSTEEAVRMFQRKNNISSFGTVNAATRVKLNELLKSKRKVSTQTVTPTTVIKLLTAPRTFGSTHEEIKKLQVFLNTNGFTIAASGPGSKGLETAYFGPGTLKALNRFQISKSLTSRTLDITTVNLINTLAQSTSTPVTTLPTTTGTFTRTLSLGMSGDDVKALQIFLNNKGFTIAVSGPGSKGNETTFFGAGTKAALIRFQEAYRAEILTPNGLTKGTGSMGPSTIRKVNELK